MGLMTKFMGTKVGSWVHQNRSDILTYGGLTLIGSSVVLAARVGLKYAKKEQELDESLNAGKIDAKTAKNKLIKSTIKTALPAAITFGLGSFGVCKGHSIIKTQYIDVSTKLLATCAAFAAYRNRVKEEQGVDKDFEYATGQKVERDEEGKLTTPVNKDDIKNQEAFTFFWDSFSRLFCKNIPELNISELRTKDKLWQIQLKTNGHLWLNDALRDLDMPEVEYGYDYGWFTEGPDDIPSDMVEVVGPVDDACIMIHFTCRPAPIKEHVFRGKSKEIEYKFY